MFEGIHTPLVEIRQRYISRRLASAAYGTFSKIAMPPGTFFVGIRHLKNGGALMRLEEYFPTSIATFICWHIAEVARWARALGISTRISGAECWTGVTGDRSRGAGYLHVDNDEQERMSSGLLRMPVLGTVLYLGPDEGLRGGETIFLEPNSGRSMGLFRRHNLSRLQKVSGAVVVTPTPGSLVAFRGNVPHAVAPAVLSDQERPRVTMLVNLWERRVSSVPAGVCSLSPEEYLGQGYNG